MSKAARQKSARERLAEERRRQADRQRRFRALLISLTALAVIGVVVAVFVVVQSNRNKPDGYAGPLAPQTRQADGSVVMARPGVQGPVLEVYEDFQCPACAKFEETTGDTVKRLAADGKVKVVYRPFRLFQQEPLKSNSQRAANAAACAPADKWIRFHDKVFKEQPPEGQAGFANKDLIDWAGSVGITGAGFEKCVNGGEKGSTVDAATQYAQQQRIEGTPSVRLNGKELGDTAFTAQGLEQAILAASAAPAASPSATPKKNS
ncbi:hypothetical protein DPM19_06330 [Actinomadura craniellae]|uniref:Thioredoxin-like fold domain-containing protein n=1 Tax=Actinomadura craniellae TaxID=2231787 RepID=A0A365HBU4_9ACTN|nr:thioredoxin domain-containing protein [Actinomadura craniellae]RAY16478.1 hypothetical protein DPM19_06330 [Actinomadura craniellae]